MSLECKYCLLEKFCSTFPSLSRDSSDSPIVLITIPQKHFHDSELIRSAHPVKISPKFPLGKLSLLVSVLELAADTKECIFCDTESMSPIEWLCELLQCTGSQIVSLEEETATLRGTLHDLEEIKVKAEIFFFLLILSFFSLLSLFCG